MNNRHFTPSTRMTAQEIWIDSQQQFHGDYAAREHARWIHDNWNKFDIRHVSTGISAETLDCSLSLCYRNHGKGDAVWNWLRTGTLAYVEHAKVDYARYGSLQSVREVQDAFIAGDDTNERIHWCGLCVERYRLMEFGVLCGYSDLHGFYRCVVYGTIGYTAWLEIARESSITQVEIARREGEKVVGREMRGVA